jgi:hypothetical protein
VVVVVAPSCGGGVCDCTKEAEAPVGGGGGGGSNHTVDPVMGDPSPPPSGSLAPDLSARVLVGLHCAPTWICVVCLGAGLDGESSTGKISMGSSSSSSSLSAFPSPPTLYPSDENLKCLHATG